MVQLLSYIVRPRSLPLIWHLFYIGSHFFLTFGHKAASLVDSSPASFPLPLRVEPKPKSGIRQQVLLKKVVEVKPKRTKFSSPSDSEAEGNRSNLQSQGQELKDEKNEHHVSTTDTSSGKQNKMENPAKSILGLTYASSDDDDD
ncbi:hypothetical protein V6N11_000600 [Hibiscus sabdariffa]|uniref:Uncharacterized protein n=1 Tax=Hibiscus sabdariffa TaxID=183260 RepID=A0ABR2N7K8_9ROSI